MLACNCMNITIELEKNDKVTKESLDLTDEEKCDSFFKQEVWHVGRLLTIKKLYPFMVLTRRIGLWTICKCLNCDVQTHAIHKDKGASYVLVHSKLLNQEAIKNIKSSELLSPIFHIVVNPNDIGPEHAAFDTYPNREAEKSIKSINDIITNYVTKEQVVIEEKIKKFADEQYEFLNIAKDRAFKERDAFIRIIQNAAREASTLQVSPKSPKGFSYSYSENHSDSAAIPRSPKRPKSTETSNQESIVLKDDLLFNFETEDFNIEDDSFKVRNLDDSESEDIEEAEDIVNEAAGISIFQGKVNRATNNLAKSCPVDIPIYSPLSRSRNHADVGEDDDFPPRPREDVDIAASIKALARSVHGDGIFGELPRPRFSTQI